ncbi:ABC transporter ATP-binding protein [Pedobacter lithocola]|uniref:ABC transporter ATP-binding protein n=1 Tax=Pedobacter lithocola TaxID=1908239 RepID=A0ABV8PGJ6_9SPHI
MHHQFGKGTSLHFDDWRVERNQHYLLLGSSGSGKSTLLHHISGLLKPTNGNIYLNGIDIYSLSERELDTFRGRYIGIVFQRPHLIKSLTIGQNLLLAQGMAGYKSDIKRIKEVLSSLDIREKFKSSTEELSQGQLQRVSIARAVINRPKLLIADEPTSSLDDLNTESVMELLLQQSVLNKTTLVVATHDQRIKHFFTNTFQL